jgi:bifunctional lysine-specific demethylase and histidyl-hydroxylase MINA
VTSRFLENLSLASLIAPITEEQFRSRYWEREVLVVHREKPDYYGDLFSLKEFDEAITRDPSYVKIANAPTMKLASYKTEMVKGLEAVLADMRDGCTLVLDQLHKKDPKLGLLCRALAPDFGHPFQSNLYLTPPHGKGFTPHWDNHDVFILQVVGSKKWQIEKERRVYPTKTENMGLDGRELRGELLSFTLNQGDLIYIPRGFVHAAESGAEASLHITLGLTGIFLEDFLYATIQAAIQRDDRLRAVMPIGFMRGAQQDIVKQVMAILRDAADETFLNTVMDEFRDKMVRSFPIDVSGQVLNHFQPAPLTGGDVVGPRRGVVYQLHNADDSVRVNFGTQSITFPGFLRPSLDFALNTAAYAIRDVAGELDDDEKIIFIERLVLEGLVVRK